MKTIASLFILATVLFHGYAFSADSSVKLAELRVEALSKNSMLSAKRKEYEAAQSRVFENWLFDDPMFGADVEGQPDLFDFENRMNVEYMVEQELPSPIEWLLKGLSAGKEAEVSYQRWREAERVTAWEVEEPFREWVRAVRSESVLAETEALLVQMAQAAKFKYESGQGDQSDALAAGIELANVRIERIREREMARVARARLSRTLGREFDPQAVPDDPPLVAYDFSWAELEAAALDQRPELKAVFAESQKAGLDRDRMLWNWVPEVKLRYEGREYPDESGIRDHDTFIGLSMPVWSVLGGLGGGWRAAHHEARAARDEYEDFRNQVRVQVVEADARARAGYEAIRIYEAEILPQARQRIRTALAAYEAGRSDFIGVLDAERTLKESELAALRARAEYEIALADLRLAVGGALPAKGDAE